MHLHRAIQKREFRRLGGGAARFILDRDVRRDIDDLADEIGLKAAHQRRDRDEEGDAQRDPRDGDQRLPPPPAEHSAREFDDEVHRLTPTPCEAM